MSTARLVLFPALLVGCCLVECLRAATALPADVRTRASGAGLYLTDQLGMSLYVYAQDVRPGKSDCNAECAKAWPPLLVSAGAAPVSQQAGWSAVIRDDGASQWAWRGKPLYRFEKDSYPGAMLGDRVGNTWRVALQPIAVPPGMAMRSIYLGRVLTDASGHTLYWRRDELKGSGPSAHPQCNADCLDAWMPQYAPWMAQPRGEWSVVAREDGQKQWAFRGHRLYSFANELKAGDTAGLNADSPWEVAVLDPAPPTPPWVTVQNSDMGEVYADASGLTLYTFNGQLDKTRALLCDDACIAQNWRTLPAPPAAKPIGDWTIVASPLGAKGGVWAYKGNAIFAHSRDREPGAIGGDSWATGVGGSGRGWVPLLRRRDYEE